MRIFTFLASLSLLCIGVQAGVQVLANQSPQPNSMRISGIVDIVDSDVPEAGLQVSINGVTGVVDPDGVFSAKVRESDMYQLKITGDRIFPTVQTFAHIELASPKRNALRIPRIELVAKKPGRVEMIFGGDVMMGRRYLEPRWNEPVLIHPDSRAADMQRLVETMAAYFRSPDFASVNLETILAAEEPPGHAPKSVVFYTHPDILPALEYMGTDYVSLGNNHTYDYLDHGLRTTIDALDQSGLGYSGAGFDEAEALAPYRTTIKGQKFSMFGYVGWAGRVLPNQIAEAGKAGAAMGSKDNIIRSLRQESADRIKIVQYHGSREYSEGPTEETEVRLKAAVDAGADLVIGHHPHVAHGLELYRGKLIAWSLGNFIFDQFFYATHGAYALKVWMDGDQFYRAEIIPLHIKTYRPIPAMGDVRRHVLQRVMTLSAQRGTFMHLSGGHGVIPQQSGVKPRVFDRATHTRHADGSIHKLSFSLAPSAKSQAYKKSQWKDTGRDLFFRGGFETHDLLGLRERSWEAKNGRFQITRTPRSGRFAMRLDGKDNAMPMQFGLKTFLRVLRQNDYTFTFWAKTKDAIKIEAFVQDRPRGMNRYTALAEAPMRSIGKRELAAGEWTQISFDFKALRTEQGRPLPLRPVLKMTGQHSKGEAPSILIDDLAVIGWQ